MTTLYHPRPERWPQCTLLVVVTLTALLLPWAVAEYHRKRRGDHVIYILDSRP